MMSKRHGKRSKAVWCRALLAMSVAPLIAACGSDPSTVRTAGTPGAAALPIQAQPAAASTPTSSGSDVSESDKYQAKLERRQGKLRVDRPSASYRPKVSKAQAFKAFQDENLFPETARTRSADVRLGLYSNDDMYVAGQPPTYQNRPVWVIRYDDVSDEMSQGQYVGSPTVPGYAPAPKPDKPLNVNILVFVDAETGKYLHAIEDTVDVG